MEEDRALQGLVAELNSTLKHETAALQETYEKWRAGQTELLKQKEALDGESKRLADGREKLEAERQRFEDEVTEKWGSRLDDRKRVVLNVGGQRFETTVKVLCRDRFSMLAAIAAAATGASGPGAALGRTVRVGKDGAWYIDRDWWTFRHVLSFLRSGSLPTDVEMLRQMYLESAYFRLNSLRVAVEKEVQRRDLPPSVLLPGRIGSLPLDDLSAIRRAAAARGAPVATSSSTSTSRGMEGGVESARVAAESALRWAAWARAVHGSGKGAVGDLAFLPPVSASEARRADPMTALRSAAAQLAAAELDADEAHSPMGTDRARTAGGSVLASDPLGPDSAGVGLVDLVKAMELRRARQSRRRHASSSTASSSRRSSLDSRIGDDQRELKALAGMLAGDPPARRYDDEDDDEDDVRSDKSPRFSDAYYTSGEWRGLYKRAADDDTLPDPLGFTRGE